MSTTTSASGTPIPTVPSQCPICGPNALHRALASSPDFEYRTSRDAEWIFHQCMVCDTVFVCPRPSEQALSLIYPENYYAYSFGESRSLGYAVKARLDGFSARTYARLYPGRGLVCDVGAGDGRLVEILARGGMLTPESVYGIEPELRAVEAARARDVDVRHASIESFDWKPNSHGLIILQQVIEHVGDPRACLSSLAASLVEGGALVIETPNTRGLDARMFAKRHWGGYHTPRHFFLFNPASLARLGELTGFRLQSIQALPSPNFWIQSLHHALSERAGAIPRSVRKLLRPHPPAAIPLALFTAVDLTAMVALRSTSNMRVIFRKPAGTC
jgi:SAM-dependent methyltransferase